MYKHLSTVLGTAIMTVACSAAQAQMVGTPSSSVPAGVGRPSTVSAGVREPGTVSATSSSANRLPNSTTTHMPRLDSKPILRRGHIEHSQQLNTSSTALSVVNSDQPSTVKARAVMPGFLVPKLSPMGMGMVMTASPFASASPTRISTPAATR